MTGSTKHWLFGDSRAPGVHDAGELRFVALGPEHVTLDHHAVMSSAPRLRAWSASTWPADDFTVEENLDDMVMHRREHDDGTAYTFSVQSTVEPLVLGCIYVMPAARALASRAAVPPAGLGSTEAVVRGWMRSGLDEKPLVTQTLTWLSGPAWPITRSWWMINTSLPDQAQICDQLGLTDEIVIPSTATTWMLRSRPLPATSGDPR
jgi:hypothetical protein